MGCRLAPVPLTPENWKTPVNPGQILWTDDGASMSLENRGGPRMHTLDGHTYGMYSLKIKADPSPGAVTAFYVSARQLPAAVWRLGAACWVVQPALGCDKPSHMRRQCSRSGRGRGGQCAAHSSADAAHAAQCAACSRRLNIDTETVKA
jgi:hypothetical protein